MNTFFSKLSFLTFIFFIVVTYKIKAINSTDGQPYFSLHTWLDISLTANPQSININISKTDVSCRGGNNGSATALATGGNGTLNFLWSNGANSSTINNLTAGSYTVTVTDQLGAQAFQSVTILEPATNVNAVLFTKTDNICFSGATGRIDMDVTGGTPNYTYSWSNGRTTEDISGLQAGTYTLTATDQLGCLSTATVIITEPSQLNGNISILSNFNGAAISCNGATDANVQVAANGGVAPYTFLWSTSPQQNTTTVNGLGAGTYNVSITDANTCIIVRSITINEPAQLEATEQHTNVFCNGDCDGQIIVSATSGTGTLGINGYEYRITGPNQSGNVFSALNNFNSLCAGVYTIEVRDGNNCTIPVTVNLTEPAQLTLTANATAASCNGTPTGSATVTPNGGTSPYNFLWSNGQNAQNATGLVAGAYSVTVTDANGCLRVTSTSVTEPSLLTSSTSFTEPSCFGSTNGTATVTPNGGTAPYSFAWSSGNASATALGLVAGNFTVTVTDAANCVTISTVIITQPAVLNVNITASALVCFGNGGGSATANTTGGTSPYSFQWSNGQTSDTATGLNAGLISVVVTDANSCQQVAQTNMTQPPILAATQVTVTNVSCSGGSDGTATISGSGGTAPYTFAWPNGQNTATATGLGTGTTTATVTDANGCSTTINVILTAPFALQVTQIVATNISCRGGNNGAAAAFINGGSSPYDFNWSNGGTGQSVTGLAAGTYQLTITDGNGCTAQSSIILSEPASFLVGTLNSSPALCFGDSSGQLTAIVSGGTLPSSGDYTYIWSNGANTPIVSNVPAGNYSVTATDANGCTIGLSTAVSQAGNLNFSIAGSTNVTCEGGNNGTATVIANGGTGALSFQWSNGQTNTTATGLTAGTYTVTVSDENGCEQSRSIDITEGAPVVLEVAQTDISCFGETDGQLSVTSSGISLYFWSTGQVGNPLSNLGVGQYAVTVTDNRGCEGTGVFNITQPTELIGTITVNSPVLCNNGNTGSLIAAASGGISGYSFAWSNGVSTSNNDSIPSGSYTLTITDANGCIALQQTILDNPDLLELTTTISDVRCIGDRNGSIQVSATGGTVTFGAYEFSIDSVNWQTGDLFPNLEADSFNVYVRDVNGCVTEQIAVVATADSFFISFVNPLDTTIELGDSVNLMVMLNDSSGASLIWTNLNNQNVIDSNSYNLRVAPRAQTAYRVSATSALGCETDTSIIVRINKERIVGAPGAFTPNNDGRNDNFFIQSNGKVTAVHVFRVYDRWGELVFEGLDLTPDDPDQGWDGTFKGEVMNSGVYAWYAEVEFIDGEREVLRGDVTLIR
jgi:gliding motility-associated-like protein